MPWPVLYEPVLGCGTQNAKVGSLSNWLACIHGREVSRCKSLATYALPEAMLSVLLQLYCICRHSSWTSLRALLQPRQAKSCSCSSFTKHALPCVEYQRLCFALVPNQVL